MATLVQADWLFLLTDVAHLYTANPNIDPTAQPIFEVFDIGDLQVRPVTFKPTPKFIGAIRVLTTTLM